VRSVVPVDADPDRHVERHLERIGRTHLLPDDLLDGTALTWRDPVGGALERIRGAVRAFPAGANRA